MPRSGRVLQQDRVSGLDPTPLAARSLDFELTREHEEVRSSRRWVPSALLAARLVRYILLAEPLLQEFAALFKGMDEQDIDTLIQSFQFKNCVQRTELARILSVF